MESCNMFEVLPFQIWESSIDGLQVTNNALPLWHNKLFVKFSLKINALHFNCLTLILSFDLSQPINSAAQNCLR